MEFSRRKVIDAAEALVEISKSIKENPFREKNGGYLMIGLNNLSHKELFSIGDYDIQMEGVYRRFVQEGAHRLLAHWYRDPGEAISSFKTKNEILNINEGAVLFPDVREPQDKGLCHIVSFYGLHPRTNEAISLVLGYDLGLARDEKHAKRVIAGSANDIAGPMFEKFREYQRAREISPNHIF